jgi:hypothetical protein
VGIYEGDDHGPLSDNPIPTANLKVFCLWKKPEARDLITDQNRDSGGTWHWHQIATKVPTSIVALGVSQKAPTHDSNGIPRLEHPEGTPTGPLEIT